ncbi:unnamed protein product [Tetraodon nigroviridis]|uniref:(spotted green pufferfish) hypothetical protein n=1 Tax=Tetraodon nigroviridis TaxID=99883 RepID=Q4SUT3_TETNG|nr:unnamed protein product [Tetraodon nigroviridis]
MFCEGYNTRNSRRAEKSRFTEELINVISSHVIQVTERKAEAHDPPSPHCSDVDAAVGEKVKKVLVLLGWWSNTQVNSCCDRMLLTLNRFRSRPEEEDTREDTDELENSDIQSDYFEDADVESNDLEDSGSEVKYFDDVVVKFENLEEEDVETFDFTHSSQSNIPKDSDVQLDNDNLLHDYFNNDEATLSSVDTTKDENNQADHQEDPDTDSSDSGDADVKSTYLEDADADAESSDFEDADVKLKGLKKKVCKKLCKEFGRAEDLLLHLSLNDEAVQDCTVAIISSLLKMQKKPSMATKFVSWLKRVFTGCCG